MGIDATDSAWFARRNGAVRGPFTAAHVRRCILLGRIQLNDELSQDERTWQALTEFPQLIPDELYTAPGREDYRHFLLARSQADERVAERRSGSGRLPSTLRTERRRLPERRRNSSWMTGILHLYELRSGQSRERQPLRILLLVTLIASLVLAYLSTSPG
jgi:hypothetical protein